jgi:ribosomal protein S16
MKNKNKNRLVIRLQKQGRIRRPYYLIIVTKAFKSAHGGFYAKVGYYDPFSYKFKNNFSNIVIYKEILNYWIKKGARPNLKVYKLLFT